jgi:hypothetical protein
MRHTLVLATLAVTAGLWSALVPGPAGAADDLAAALARAGADGKPVLIDFFTDW